MFLFANVSRQTIMFILEQNAPHETRLVRTSNLDHLSKQIDLISMSEQVRKYRELNPEVRTLKQLEALQNHAVQPGVDAM